MNPKIALVVPAFGIGGGVSSVGQFVYESAVQSGRYEVSVVSLPISSRDSASVRLLNPQTWRRGIQIEEGERYGISYRHVGAFFSELEFQRYMARKALNELVADCDLIQIVAGTPAWANAFADLKVPISLQVATRAVLERRFMLKGDNSLTGIARRLMTQFTDRLDNKGIRSVNAIQVENPYMLEYCKLIGDPTKQDIRYAPPGVDALHFHPRHDLRDDGNPYILCVGRLNDPRKNIGLLLEAFALFAINTNYPVRLRLAGSSSPPQSFWDRVSELRLSERVEFLKSPSADELLQLYQAATIFVLPSDEEGLGIVVLEAMACGLPVISTRSGGPEGIIDEGRDGFLTPLNDPKEISLRLRQLFSDDALREEIGNRARSKVLKNFSSQVCANTFVSVWDSLCRIPSSSTTSRRKG